MDEKKTMSKNNPSIMQDFRQKPLAYLVQIVGVLVIIANLWIASKLAPLTEDLIVLQSRVEAHDTDHVKIQTEVTASLDKTDIQLRVLDDKVDMMSEDIAVIKSILSRD